MSCLRLALRLTLQARRPRRRNHWNRTMMIPFLIALFLASLALTLGVVAIVSKLSSALRGLRIPLTSYF